MGGSYLVELFVHDLVVGGRVEVVDERQMGQRVVDGAPNEPVVLAGPIAVVVQDEREEGDCDTELELRVEETHKNECTVQVRSR